MNILIVAHGYPCEKDPQWGCFEKDQAEALAKLGHKVTIVAVDGRHRKYKRQRGIVHYSDGNINAYTIYYFPLAYLLAPYLYKKARAMMMLKLYEHVIKEQGLPDIIYAHFMFCIEELYMVKKRYHVPILGLEHWSVLNMNKLSSDVLSSGRRAYGIVDKLLAVSPSLQSQIKKHFNIETEVLYDMVNEVFLQQPLVEKSFKKPFKFVSVGSLNHWKAFDILVKSFAGIKNRDTELYIIGDGEDRSTIEGLIHNFNLSGRVHLLGRLDKEAIIQRLSEADAFVLPSRGETFGVAYVEALAMGLPVIATRCGGPESFMTDECGLMVDVDDVEGLTVAMDKLQETINTFDSHAIREYIRSRFSGEVIAKQLVEYLNNIIK